MRSITDLVGIVLIVLGVVLLGYQGISYTQRENVAQIGDIHVTADTEKTIYFPPYTGGVALVAGIAVLLIGRRGN